MPAARHQRDRHLIEVAPDAVLLVTHGRVTYANPAAAGLFGTETAEELVGRPLVVLFDDAAYRDILARALAGSAQLAGAREPFGVRIAPPGGEERPCEAVVVATSFSARPATAIFLRDLSHLQEAELRYRSVTDTAPDAVVTVDATGAIVSWNRGAERIFGYSEEEATGQPVTILIPPRHREDHARALARANATGEGPFLGRTVELTALRADGSEFPIELSLSTWESGGRRHYTGIIRDITDRKAAEDALRHEEARYRSLFEHSPAALVEMDLQGVVGWMDRLRSRGVTDLSDHLARHPGDLRLGISLIRVTRVNRRALDLLEAGSEEELLGDINPDRFDAEMLWGMGTQLAALWEGEEFQEAELSFTTRKETPIVCRVRWAVPICLGEADWSRAVLVLEDVTERRAAEGALVDALEAQGDFIASVAHELRTPLTAVLGFSEILEEGWQALPPEEREELIGLVARSGAEAAGFLDDLFVAARGRIDAVTISPRAVDLGRELRTVWSALSPELAARVEVPAVSVTVVADPPRLRQVIRNLCRAADRGPEVRVWMTVEEEGDRATIRLCHDGPPLPEERRRLLEGGSSDPRSLSVPDLGLRVARQLSGLMGGSLRYRAGEVQSAFELVMPVPPEGPPTRHRGPGAARGSSGLSDPPLQPDGPHGR